MKMSAKLFNDLKNDVEIVANFSVGIPKNMKEMWGIFHAVMFDRMNDDTHPAFANGRPRFLPGHAIKKLKKCREMTIGSIVSMLKKI